jgi:hypothetical protein
VDRLDNLGNEGNSKGTVGIPFITHASPDEAFLVHHTRDTDQDRKLPPARRMLEIIARELAPHQLQKDLGDCLIHDSVLGDREAKVKTDGWCHFDSSNRRSN